MFNQVLLLLLAAAGSLAAAPSAKPLNVLFFAVDDLRPELRCYGHDTILTPNIDRIAAKGMAFKRAYCQQAVCSPSRSSLLTGTRPDTTKVWDLETHFRVALPDVVTLPQHFKNNGYFVQGMGKIFHGGFDDPPSWSVPWQTPRASSYAKPENLALTQEKTQGEPDGKSTKKKKKASRGPRGPAFESGDVPDSFYQDGKVAELAVATLREIKQKNQPFFLAVGFIKPHLPSSPPRNIGTSMTRPKSNSPPIRLRPKTRRRLRSLILANCARIMASQPAVPFPTTWRGS